MSRPRPLGLSDGFGSDSVDMDRDDALSLPRHKDDDGRKRSLKSYQHDRLDQKEPPLQFAPTNGGSSWGSSQRPMNERDRDNHHPYRESGHERRPEASSVKGSGSSSRRNPAKKILDMVYGREPSYRQSYAHRVDDIDSRETPYQETTHLREIEELRLRLTDANAVIETLQGRLKVHEEISAQLKRRNNVMQSSLDAQYELLGRQEQDSNISGEFDEIFIQLKNWTSRFCSSAKSPMQVTDVHRENFELIRRVLPSLASAEDLPEFLPPNYIRRRRNFVRGWVGLILAEFIICSLPEPSYPASAAQDFWMPPATRNSITELQKTLLESGEAVTLTAFHRWRTITMAMLDKVYTPIQWPQDTINLVDDRVDFALSAILPLTSQPGNGEQRQKLIDNIFFPALSFSQLLRRQCACWSVRFPDLAASNRFEPSTMVDVDNQPEDDVEGATADQCSKSVKIVVTPALFKSGNQDGLRYDMGGPVQEAEVSCAEFPAVE
ncbi:hypothetical protein B0T10DRAFT_587564 [Thelonectria olida]|uniref:Uncharacterized protein n=1 Tax=Thelonectria olida TaxID=1576542 RepID=A0A9P8WF81_9HYPO|nr:hypothetical protein B0T10DRAFT_587564 [Thelonectria olida]